MYVIRFEFGWTDHDGLLLDVTINLTEYVNITEILECVWKLDHKLV